MERWKCEKSDLQKYHKYEKQNFHKVDHGKARKTAGSVKLKEEEGKRPSNKTKKVCVFFLIFGNHPKGGGSFSIQKIMEF